MSIIGKHKIFGHYGGRFHFAEVGIEIQDIDSADTVFKIHLEENDGIDQVFDDWKNAAIRGLRRFSHDFPQPAKGKSFVVNKILATLVDTEDETIEVASYLAAFQALFPKEMVPKISFDRSWTISR